MLIHKGCLGDAELIRNPRVLKKLGIAPKTVIHVGAHHAQDHTEYQELGALKILWFEGDKENVEWLRQHRPDVDVRHCVLWNIANYDLKFYAHEDSSQSSANVPVTSENVKVIELKSSTLDIEISKEMIHEPVALVIDVQGSEKEVIEGAHALLEKVSFLIIELSYRNSRYQFMPNPVLIERDLISRGFRHSISRVSHDGTYVDQLFIRKKWLKKAQIELLDIVFTLLLAFRHCLVNRHLVYDYRNCKKCFEQKHQ